MALSGTEYEFENARDAGKDVLLYRRTAKVFIDADDKEFDEQRRQKQLVDRFFEELKKRGRGVQPLRTTEDFHRDFEAHIKARP